MKQLTPLEFLEWKDSNKDHFLVDVRERWEHEAYNIGGMHIPMNELMGRITEIPSTKDVVIYCEKGIRSAIVIQRLEGMGFRNLYNLTGGMKAWRESLLSPD